MSITDEGVIHETFRKTRTTSKPLKKNIFIVHRYYTVKTDTLKYVLKSKGANILNNLWLKFKKMHGNLQCIMFFYVCEIRTEISDNLPLVEGKIVL